MNEPAAVPEPSPGLTQQDYLLLADAMGELNKWLEDTHAQTLLSSHEMELQMEAFTSGYLLGRRHGESR